QLDGVANQKPSVLRAGHRALDEDQAANRVGADDLEALLRALAIAHVAGHLLVLEDLARILALPGRTVGTVADRPALGGAHPAEAPALHRTGNSLALRMAGDVDVLPGHEVLGADRRADREETVLAVDAEFGDLLLQRHLRLGEMLALRLGDVLLLGFARADLDSDVSVTIGSAMRNHLTILQRQNGDRHVAAVLLEQARHPGFLGGHACAHGPTPSTEACRSI